MSTAFVIWHLFAYHLATWYFLRQGTCVFHCHCGTSNDMTLKTHLTNLTPQNSRKCPKIKVSQESRGKKNFTPDSPISISPQLLPSFFQLFKKKNNPKDPNKKQKSHQLLDITTKPSNLLFPPPNLKSP